jgi:putative ABC transport system ATP-binding protein
MKLFEQLHAGGHTICLVTHEPRLAARCPRAIRLKDGQIIADGKGSEVALQQLAGAA